MNLKIFKDAFGIYQGGQVKPESVTGRTVSFNVKDVNVRVENTLGGLRFHCGCEAHMKRMAQDKLCKRTIAALVYIARQKKIVQSLFVNIAKKMSSPSTVWIDSVEKNTIQFDVNGKKVWIERIPTGTRVRTIKDSEGKRVIQDKFSLEMVAAVLYVYDHRGKIKK